MSDEHPVFDGINLVVGDMDKTIAFYALLGLPAAPTAAEWAGHHRNLPSPNGFDFDLDSTAFAPTWDRGWPAGRTGAVLGFRVDSREAVDATYARLTGAGYEGQQEPWDAFWGARYAIVADPDGNPVGIMSAIDPERRTQPADPAS